jgi:hypothetical protein
VLALSVTAGADRAQAQDAPDDIVQQFFDEFEAGDTAGAVALFTDDAVVTDIGRESFAAYGKPAIEVWIAALVDDSPSFTLTNVQVNDNTVTGRVEWSDANVTEADVDRIIQPFTITVTDDGLMSRQDYTYDENDAQTEEWLDYSDAQPGDDHADDIRVPLAAQPGGNQPGDAFIEEVDVGVSSVELDVAPGAEGVLQPAHFHTGTCAAPGPIVEPLASVLDGESFTLLSAAPSELVDIGLIINVHLSAEQASTYVSCGVVGATVAQPIATPPTAVPGTPAPAATATPSGVTAPDTGTGGATGGGNAWMYALIAVGAVLVTFGAGGVARQRRKPRLYLANV